MSAMVEKEAQTESFRGNSVIRRQRGSTEPCPILKTVHWQACGLEECCWQWVMEKMRYIVKSVNQGEGGGFVATHLILYGRHASV